MRVSIRKIKARFYDHFDGHMAEVVHGASVAFLMKVLAAGLGFGLNILLARILGADGAGLYFLALTVVTVGMTIGRFGLDNTILRFVAMHASRGEWGAVKGVYRKSILLSTGVSSLVTLTLILSAPWLSESFFRKPDLAEPLQWMSLSVFPMAMLFLHSEAIKALKKVRDSQLVNGVLLPCFAICALVFLAPRFGVTGAAWSQTAGAVFAAIAGWWIWRRKTLSRPEEKGEFLFSSLFQSSMPLLWISLMGMVINWTAIFLLGIWGTNSEVGVFAAASRTAMLTSFILVSVNSIAAPKFAALYAIKDIEGVQRVARQSTKMMTLMAVPLLVVFLLAPGWVMGFFGPDFEKGGNLLAILAFGQFINVATGSVGYLLMMTGNERTMRNVIFLIGTFNVLISSLMIQMWGEYGAAIATAISVSVLNLCMYQALKRRVGISIVFIPSFTAKER